MRVHVLSLLIAAAAAPNAATASAFEPPACADGRPRPASTISLRLDNDVISGQDQGYSNGVQLTLVSPGLDDEATTACLPHFARWLDQRVGLLGAHRFQQRNLIATLAHGIFTPTDYSRRDLIHDDRPYAAVLLAGLGYNVRNDDRLHTTQLQFGVVGPSAQGKQTQNSAHKLLGGDRFRGWDHQLQDEPVFRLVHERMRRYRFDTQRQDERGWDAIAHGGGSFGNLSTYANAGAELRYGLRLPEDFGSTPLRPAGENTATDHRGDPGRRPFAAHVFLASDLRWVLRDITLDGNTFRRSHRVDKRRFVGEIGYGVALIRGRWKFALARYHSSREFEGQEQRPVFGSLTASLSF